MRTLGDLRRSRHPRLPWRHGVKRGRLARPPAPRCLSVLPRRVFADRKTLLLGTALASTLLIGILTPQHPVAAAVFVCNDAGTGPAPIYHHYGGDILCVNAEPRTGTPASPIPTPSISHQPSRRHPQRACGI
jgi:hypothetical protein